MKTDFGYHVIRLDDVRPLKVPDFSEMKEQFRQRAQQAQQVVEVLSGQPRGLLLPDEAGAMT